MEDEEAGGNERPCAGTIDGDVKQGYDGLPRQRLDPKRASMGRLDVWKHVVPGTAVVGVVVSLLIFGDYKDYLKSSS